MYTKSTSVFVGPLFLLILGGLGAGNVCAQEAIHLYAPSGVSPAIEDAAFAFAERNGMDVQVTTGPAAEWRERIKGDGDLLYNTGEFITSDFVRTAELPVDETQVTPLFLRPAVILVRPGNPKDIRDFPDLLRPGMRVMLVNGSGQTGLWEDMTGKLQSLQNLVALQKNIVLCAPDTGEAMRIWRAQGDIDAWITWNVWYVPRRDRATIVPISRAYQIYRKCSISFTERGKRSSPAGRFVDFLASREGAAIFHSWGWIEAPPDAIPAVADKGVCVVCRIRKDTWTNSVGRGLTRVKRMVEEFASLGIPYEDIHVCAVFDGEASYWMLTDQAYKAFTGNMEDNPNRLIVQELTALGVSIELSVETMHAYGWTAEDVLPDVRLVPEANERIADLGRRGYDYLPF